MLTPPPVSDPMGPRRTGVSGLTMTLKLLVALRGGRPLSVTITVTGLVVPARATGGRHVKTPLALSRVVLEGAANRLKVRVCGGDSASVALLVRMRITPALMVWSATGASTGAVLVLACPTKVTTLR